MKRRIINVLFTLVVCIGMLTCMAFTVSADGNNSYTVTFDAGEGTGTKEPVTGVSGEYTLPGITTTTFAAPEGKEFKGWEINGTIYAENATINVTSDITAKAIWVIPTSIQLQSKDFYLSKAVGYQLDQKITRYWKNGDSSQFTGTADDYNVKIEWSVRNGKDVATITLKGANTADTDNTNYGLTVLAANTFDVDIVVEEDSVLDQFTLYSCDVSISGDGKLTIVDPKVDAQNIYVDGNLTLNGSNVNVTTGNTNAVYVKGGNLSVLNGAKLTASNTSDNYPAVYADKAVTINGADVTASSTANGALGAAGLLSILNDAVVKVESGTLTASVIWGSEGILVDNAKLNAKNTAGSSVISSWTTITTINGAVVTAENTEGNGAAIVSEGNLNITDSTVTVTANASGRGISSNANISIAQSNGKTEVTVESNGIAIAARSGKLTISGGTVKLTSYANNAMRANEIEIIGGNAEANASASNGIYCDGIVTISGSAKVQVNSSSTGLVAVNNITISGTADVKASGQWALWSKASNIAISGGTVEAIGSSYALVSKPVLTGYTNPVVFAGADTSSAEIIVDTANTAYHGMKYVKIQPGYIITFDANGGTLTDDAVASTDTDGKLSTMPSDPTLAGYTFSGWFDARTGGNLISETTVFNNNTTIYAQWSPKSANAGITAVSVNGIEGTIDGSTITVTLPKGEELPTDISAISITTADGADVSNLATTDSGKTWTFTVTAEDGSTTADYTIYVTVNDITIPIHNENKTEDETVHVRAEIEEGTNTATVTEVYIDLENVIGDEVDTGVVTIDFSALQEVPEYAALEIDTIVIPTDIIHNIAEAAKDAHNDTEGLEIVLAENLSIQFDAVALDRKMEQTESDGKITVSILPKEHERAYLNETQHSAVGERPAYNIRLSDENGEEIHDLGGEIILKAPYTLGSNENPKGIVVYYVAEDGSRERCETSYDSAGKCVTWKTDHLSVYMIEYEPVISKIPALCDLSFETNGGTALPTVPRAFGSQAGLSRFIPARDGYTFTGWYADEDLTRKITKIVMIGNVTVYAGWESAADEE